jgi:hypothetical protein
VTVSSCQLEQPAPVSRYVYGGIDGQGNARTGVTIEAPAEFASRQHRNGWRRLEIRAGDEAGEVVGAIEPHPDSGTRVWWAER